MQLEHSSMDLPRIIPLKNINLKLRANTRIQKIMPELQRYKAIRYIYDNEDIFTYLTMFRYGPDLTAFRYGQKRHS